MYIYNMFVRTEEPPLNVGTGFGTHAGPPGRLSKTKNGQNRRNFDKKSSYLYIREICRGLRRMVISNYTFDYRQIKIDLYFKRGYLSYNSGVGTHVHIPFRRRHVENRPGLRGRYFAYCPPKSA